VGQPDAPRAAAIRQRHGEMSVELAFLEFLTPTCPRRQRNWWPPAAQNCRDADVHRPWRAFEE
jgi:hypothetical protein